MGVYTVGDEKKIRTALTIRLFQDIRDDHTGHRIEHFANCLSCVLMLLPQHTEGDMARIMGNISAALVETPSFLEAVKAGNRNVIYSILEAELSDFLSGYCKDKLKN